MRKKASFAVAFLFGILIAVTTYCGNPEEGGSPNASILQAYFAGDTTGHPEPAVDTDVNHRISSTFARGTRSGYTCLVKGSWSRCPDEDFESYRLYRSEYPHIEARPESAQQVAYSANAYDTTFSDEEIEWSRRYYYALKTTNSQLNSAWSNELSLLTPTIENDPPEPANLEADTVGYTKFGVSWPQCPDIDFRKYSLYSSQTPGASSDTLHAQLEMESNDIRLTQFDRDTEWESYPLYVSLRTRDLTGNLSWSNEVAMEPPDPGLILTDVIPIGPFPEQVCLLEGTSQLYATNCFPEGKVKVIDTESGTVTDSIDVGERPFGLCALPAEDRIYVTLPLVDKVAVIRTSDNSVIDTVAVSDSPFGISATLDGRYVMVACFQADVVEVIRTSDNTVVEQVPVEKNPWNLLPDPEGRRMYVACSYWGDLVVIGLPGFTVQGSVRVSAGAVSVTLGPQDSLAFISCSTARTVDIVDTSTLEVIGTIPTSGSPGMITSGILSCPLLANEGSSNISIYDPGTFETLFSTANGEGLWCPLWHGSESRLYVSDYAAGTLCIFQSGPGMPGIGYFPQLGSFGGRTGLRVHVAAALGR